MKLFHAKRHESPLDAYKHPGLIRLKSIEPASIQPGTTIRIAIPEKTPITLTLGETLVSNTCAPAEGFLEFTLHNLGFFFADIRAFHSVTGHELPGSPIIGWTLSHKERPQRIPGRGRLEGLNGQSLKGWYYSDDAELNRTTRIVILLNGIEVARTPLHLLRPDLLRAGMRAGRYGFSVNIAKHLFRSSLQEVRAYCEKTGVELDRSPMRLPLSAIIKKSRSSVANSKMPIFEPPSLSSMHRGQWSRNQGRVATIARRALSLANNDTVDDSEPLTPVINSPMDWSDWWGQDAVTSEVQGSTLALVEFLNDLKQGIYVPPGYTKGLIYTLIDALGLKALTFFDLISKVNPTDTATQSLVLAAEHMRHRHDERLKEHIDSLPTELFEDPGATRRLLQLLFATGKRSDAITVLNNRTPTVP